MSKSISVEDAREFRQSHRVKFVDLIERHSTIIKSIYESAWRV